MRKTQLAPLAVILPLTLAALWGPPTSGAPATRAAAVAPTPTPVAVTGSPHTWEEVHRLVSEQKLKAALALVDAIREDAAAAGDDAELTRAIVEQVKLRTALHGYETAVRFLRQTPWPDDPIQHAVLDLYYANSLVTYLNVYSWEIGQRQKVVGTETVDLEAWTGAQISAEANRAFHEVWNDRARLGDRPVKTLERYIRPSTYPERIRGTLRDAVTYMWTGLLANTRLWRPGQQDDLYLLDLKSLIAGDPAASRAVDLDSATIHPLIKIGAILDDLETWHTQRGEPEAALEVRLERLRVLHRIFTDAEDRKALRDHLARTLERFDASLPWWSMGRAELAEFVREEDSPDALIRARKIAQSGQRAHPESIGGQRCRAIVGAIEAPDYRLEAMATDGPHRRSIRVMHRNLATIWFRAYTFDLERRIAEAQDYNLLPGHREVAELLDHEHPVVQWRADLPATPDYRSHSAYVTPPMVKPGLYVVIASARQDFAVGQNRRRAVNFLLSDLVLVTRAVEDSLEVTVRDGATGGPVQGAEVALYRSDWREGHTRVAELRSIADGRVVFPKPGRYSFVVAAKDGQQALHTSPSHGYPHRRSERQSSLVFTDRSIYRPGQTIRWKVVAYRGGGEDLRFRTLASAAVTMTLRDANHRPVATTTVTTNSFGSADGAFVVPAGRLLGAWSVGSSLGGSAAVHVEEYKRPTFEVEIAAPKQPLRLNRRAALTGHAGYYFGLPVSTGTVTWRVERVPVYPRWWGWWYPVPSTAPRIVAGGRAEVGADGNFTVEFTPAADEREAGSGVTYRFRLAADVTDEGGETRSAERTIRLGFVSVEARISEDAGFLHAGRPVKLSITRTDLDGTPAPGDGSWKLVELTQPEAPVLPADEPGPGPRAGGWEAYRTAGDALRPRWRPDYQPQRSLARWQPGREVASGTLTHDQAGSATVALTAPPPGAYRLVYTTRDAYGAELTTTRDLIVSGVRRAPVRLPLLLEVERSSVPVGGTARLLARSAIPGQEMVLELYRDGRRTERRVLHGGRDVELIEIPIGENDRGGFGVTLTALADHQMLQLTSRVFVPWDDRKLAVSFSTFRDTLRPGTHETFAVTVKGADGRALAEGAAELLAYMYDASLDLFVPHTPPNPLGIYPDRTAAGRAQPGLGEAQIAFSTDSGFAPVPSSPRLATASLEGISGYGIGGLGRRGVYLRAAKAGMVEEAMVADAVMPASAPAPARQEEDKAKTWAVQHVGGAGGEAAAPVELRSNFAETAFWAPHLTAGPDGTATITFTVPDSVTEWNVWAHAITRDLRAGSVHRTTRSVKDLMVRPYLPRFLREGDAAELRVAVNNAGTSTLSGTLDLEIFDPDTNESLLAELGLTPSLAAGRPFTVEPGGGTTLTFPVRVPARVGMVAFKAVARAGDLSDGELRPLPILPGRYHLAQSRFVTLRDDDRRTMTFPDLARTDDPSRIDEQLVVTVDGQLFYGLLNALPYLVDYPYQCTEQTLNRFVSTTIVTSVFDRYPAVAAMAKKLAARDTRLEQWDRPDPNRKMLLEETPWLVEAAGGGSGGHPLIKVLDPAVAEAVRSTSLAQLGKAQTSLGGFPWWPGGPPSPFMTLYILSGLSHALEMGGEVPKPMVVRAWSYLHRHYIDEMVRLMMSEDCCWETITFLNYVLSSYPDDSWSGGVFTAEERQTMLDFSFRHWRQHSPRTKAYLALTLKRAGRAADAKLVFDSVMDSATTTRDGGTFWAPEDRAWLWYNDTIESEATTLRALTELDPADQRRHGIVQWLYLNKKLNHWKSTRATAEVIYAVVHYLEHEHALGGSETITVDAGPRTATFAFAPDSYTGARNQLVVPGDKIAPAAMSTIEVSKQGKGFAFASATWHFSTEALPEAASGDLLAVERRFFKRVAKGNEWTLEPISDHTRLAPGDEVEVQLAITARHAAEYVHLRDPRGAGFEPTRLTSGYSWNLGIAVYEEVRDSGENFFFEQLPAGQYTFSYRLRAATAGTFRVGPATLQSMYAPEFTAYSSGALLKVAP